MKKRNAVPTSTTKEVKIRLKGEVESKIKEVKAKSNKN